MAAGERVSGEERRVQLLDLAHAKVSEIDPEKLRLRKFIFVAPRGYVEKIGSDLSSKILRMVFYAYTRAGAVVAFIDWILTTEPRRARTANERYCTSLTAQAYVDSFFKPKQYSYYFMEVPLETEDVYSPDCASGPKRAAVEPDADDAE